MKTEIERYIEFALKNELVYYGDFKVIGFYLCNKTSPSEDCILKTEIDDYGNKVDIIRLITSKEFIEAIARGIYKEEKDDEGNIIPINFYELDITYKQAIAIREDKLSDYITKILGK